MNNKTYDKLKWIAMIVIPAVATLVGTVGVSVGWAQTDLAVTIITAVGVFLGTVLGVSNQNYNKTK
ncbi:phage holin [Vagococcus fluvialis]|uniref:phage holin n=1 Tax=Vagococcus fluvialis TaxID=2738 RepID=UPI001D0A0197|nr:phage holin [Vagococcus fluvialis]UDM70656.1 phage holin [Vagococcus fluvialis]UDM78075.1 phage holin [Vagococcus fluvialis]UDM82344.1 phage holin [Vagococcus fluvialis]